MRESSVDFFLNTDKIKFIFEKLHQLTSIPFALLSLEGNVIAGSPRKNICTLYHLQNNTAHQNCLKCHKDLMLLTDLSKKENLVTCVHGFKDFLIPLFVDHIHMANILLGPFFLEDEGKQPESYYRSLASEYHFDEKAYIESYKEVPLISKTNLTHYVDLVVQFSSYILEEAITKNKELHRLEQNKQHIEMALDAANMGCFEYYYIEDKIVWDDRMYHIFSQEKNTFRPNRDNFLSLIDKKDQENVQSALVMAIQTEGQLNLKFDIKTHHQESRTIRLKGKIFNQYDTPLFLGLCWDITDQTKDAQTLLKQTEELLKAQQRLECLLRVSEIKNSSVQDLLDTALEESLKLTQGKLGYIYFYSEEKKEFTLNSWSKDVMPVCTLAKKEQIYQLDKTGIWGEVVRQRKPIIINEFEAPHPLKKGYPEGHAPLKKFMSVPVFIDDQIVAVIGNANKESDYTEEDVAQLSLFMNFVWKKVEALNLEKDKDLMKQKLLNSSKMAHLGTMAFNVAHEINNPLMAIIGHTELIKEKIDPHNLEIVKLLEQEQKAIEHLGHIVGQLKGLARTPKVTLVPLNLNNIIDEFFSVMSPILKEGRIRYHIDFKAQHPIFLGHHFSLQQVILNLLVNAKDALKDSKAPVIKMTTKNDNNKLLLSIEDNGSGIPEGILAHIFDPFFTTKAEGKGTGLGLSIVKNLIQSMEGDISVTSVIHEGTSFHISFPIHEDYVMSEQKTKEEVQNTSSFEGNILILEDDASIRFVLKEYLTKMGLCVYEEENGQKALTLLEEKSFQFVFCDLHLPTMNGDIFIERAKSSEKNKHLKMAILSGSDIDDLPPELSQKLKSISDGYLKKPFGRSEIVALLEQMRSSHSSK